MIKPETPTDEHRRLAMLRSLAVLDTEAEDRFDRVTRIAQRLFDVPIALVSLVDADRQWFKSVVGLDAVETPRDVSFCGHAILGDQLFVVDDALNDERFADNPLVLQDPSIRFYAGRPLNCGGHRIGTLCIVDRQPRTLDAASRALFDDLAAVVEAELMSAELATIDQLTGLCNRRGFTAIANHALASCERFGKDAALLLIDLDGFKQINDTFGHAAGDEALKDMANVLATTFRGSDNIARLGGDEFCVLLSGTSRLDLPVIEARLSEAVRAMNRYSGRGYGIRYSMGAVCFDSARHDGLADLVRDADERMYNLKRSRAMASAPLLTLHTGKFRMVRPKA